MYLKQPWNRQTEKIKSLTTSSSMIWTITAVQKAIRCLLKGDAKLNRHLAGMKQRQGKLTLRKKKYIGLISSTVWRKRAVLMLLLCPLSLLENTLGSGKIVDTSSGVSILWTAVNAPFRDKNTENERHHNQLATYAWIDAVSLQTSLPFEIRLVIHKHAIAFIQC